jgi:ketosteroid isomerase-like protein
MDQSAALHEDPVRPGADANREIVLSYYKALEAGDGDALFALYDPAVIQTEWPNQLKPKGDRRGLDRLKADFERGKGVLRSQSYDIKTLICGHDNIAVEATWEGVLAVPLGTLQPGDVMTAHIATVFTFRDGRIISQRNYDCFEPF